MSNIPEGFEELHQDVFLQAQRALAQMLAAKHLKEQAKVLEEAIAVTERTIDLANEMAKDGDVHKVSVATSIKDSVKGALHHVVHGTSPLMGGREAVEATPFSESSIPSAQRLENLSPKQIGSEPPQTQQKRRGRPPKRSNG